MQISISARQRHHLEPHQLICNGHYVNNNFDGENHSDAAIAIAIAIAIAKTQGGPKCVHFAENYTQGVAFSCVTTFCIYSIQIYIGTVL